MNQSIKYGEYFGEIKEGETKILRNLDSLDGLKGAPDELNTGLKIFERAIEIYPNITYSTILNGEINKVFFISQIRDYSKNYCKFLYENNLVSKIELEGREYLFVGIYSKNCPEWMIAHIGNMYGGFTTVSIYDTLGNDGVEYIMNLTQFITLVVSLQNIDKIIDFQKQGKLKYVKNIILIVDESSKSQSISKIQLLELNGMKVYFFNQFITDYYNDNNFLFPKCSPETVITVSFTSGSTGIPKGAIITHLALANQAYRILLNFPMINENDRHFSYLPYAHIMETTITLINLLSGVLTIYFSGDILKLASDMVVAKPNIFFAVPRILNRIYNGIKEKLSSLTGIKKKLLTLAIKEKTNNLQLLKKFDHFFFDNLFFKDICQSVFGSKELKFIFSGSAPISQEVLDFFKIFFSCPVFEGYGMTECVGGATVSRKDDSVSGHVGGPLQNSEIKLINAPEFNYLVTDKDLNGNNTPRGEILIRSTSMFSGYLCNKKETDEILKDGWLHSGDIGIILPNNCLKIIDRRKNIFKLSQGEYITPEKIERVLEKSKYVFQVYVYGISLESYIVSLIVVLPNMLTSLAKEKLISFMEESDLLTNEIILNTILNDLTRLCKENHLNSLETPKKIMLSYTPFSVENNFLTVTNKIRRPKLKEAYGEKLKALYNN